MKHFRIRLIMKLARLIGVPVQVDQAFFVNGIKNRILSGCKTLPRQPGSWVWGAQWPPVTSWRPADSSLADSGTNENKESKI
jgi:hypothetical protein